MRVTPAVAILEKKFSAVVLVKPMVKSCMSSHQEWNGIFWKDVRDFFFLQGVCRARNFFIGLEHVALVDEVQRLLEADDGFLVGFGGAVGEDVADGKFSVDKMTRYQDAAMALEGIFFRAE